MNPDFEALVAQAGDLIGACRRVGATIATAESCTGGLIAAVLTEVPGSSDVVDCGFVTYSNAAKIAQLGVPRSLVEAHGAVSREVAQAMAEGVLSASRCTLAVAVTGIAGPGGGSADKPVGLVHLAAGRRDGDPVSQEARYGDLGRRAVRLATVRDALDLLRHLL